MSVYFIQNEKGSIKIGSGKNPYSRVSVLSTGSDENLKIIGIKPGSYYEERNLHVRFSDAHINREWFRPVPELLEYINSEQDEDKEYSENLIIRDLQKRIDHIESMLETKENREDNRSLKNNADIFLEGIKISVKNNVRPSIKIILDRRKALRSLSRSELSIIINTLIEEDKIIVDNSRRVTVYFPNPKPNPKPPPTPNNNALPPICGW